MIVTYYVRILMEASSVPALRDSSFILTRNNVTVSPFYLLLHSCFTLWSREQTQSFPLGLLFYVSSVFI